MLSNSLFNRLTIAIFEDVHYEALTTLGDPMVLHDGEDGHPIASVHLKCGDGRGEPCLITRQFEHLFQAFPTTRGSAMFVVITNLEFFDYIMFGYAIPNTGDQGHILLRPGESQKHILPPQAQDFTFAVCPTKAGVEYIKAKWTCPGFICRQRILEKEAPILDDPPEPEELDENCVSQFVEIDLVQPVYIAHQEQRVPLSRAEMLKRGMTLIYETAIERNNQLLKQMADKRFVSDECVICMADDYPPNIILVKCGHQMVHDDCLRISEKPKECPVCREEIVAKIHL